MDTQNEPRRIVPPRPPPVAVGIKDPDDRSRCSYCGKLLEIEELVMHIYIQHEM